MSGGGDDIGVLERRGNHTRGNQPMNYIHTYMLLIQAVKSYTYIHTYIHVIRIIISMAIIVLTRRSE